MDDRSVASENGAVTGTVPGTIGIVPCHGAALMRAGRGERMKFAALIFPYRDLGLVLDDHTTVTARDVFDFLDNRLAVAALVEILGIEARGIEELLPRARPHADQ